VDTLRQAMLGLCKSTNDPERPRFPPAPRPGDPETRFARTGEGGAARRATTNQPTNQPTKPCRAAPTQNARTTRIRRRDARRPRQAHTRQTPPLDSRFPLHPQSACTNVGDRLTLPNQPNTEVTAHRQPKHRIQRLDADANTPRHSGNPFSRTSLTDRQTALPRPSPRLRSLDGLHTFCDHSPHERSFIQSRQNARFADGQHTATRRPVAGVGRMGRLRTKSQQQKQ